MPTYKVTYEATVDGFFAAKKITGVELYEAKDIKEAYKKAEKEIEKAKREAGYSIFMSRPIIVIKDVEKVE